MIAQSRVKRIMDGAAYTASSSPITASSGAFAVGTDKKFNAVKVIVPFKATGSAAKTLQIELQSDTGAASAYQSIPIPAYVAGTVSAPTITPLGTDGAHGYFATTGTGVVEATYDLDNAKVGNNLEVKLTSTFVATSVDTIVTDCVLLEFFNSREEPPVSTTGTTAT
jgi:hypothetical protein